MNGENHTHTHYVQLIKSLYHVHLRSLRQPEPSRDSYNDAFLVGGGKNQH